jgi:hypothetical protein
LDVKADAAEWLLVFFFDNNMEAFAALGIRMLHINVSRLWFLLLKVWNIRSGITFSVRACIQANTIATTLKYMLCSHTRNESHGKKGYLSCLYACKNITSCNGKPWQVAFLFFFFFLFFIDLISLLDPTHGRQLVPLTWCCVDRSQRRHHFCRLDDVMQIGREVVKLCRSVDALNIDSEAVKLYRFVGALQITE